MRKALRLAASALALAPFLGGCVSQDWSEWHDDADQVSVSVMAQYRDVYTRYAKSVELLYTTYSNSNSDHYCIRIRYQGIEYKYVNCPYSIKYKEERK